MNALAAPQDRSARPAIYNDLHQRQLANQRASNARSAQTILSRLFASYRPSSLLDVGCGLGTWLAVAHTLGVSRVRGVDGPWLDESALDVDRQLVSKVDLEKAFDLKEAFDLAVSLEVGEHLSDSAAAGFVTSLTRHAPVVLFSAAIPYQGGHHHVNERWPSYWADLFQRQEFVVVDGLRTGLWHDDSIMWWLRQNLLLFVRKDILESHAPLRELHQRVDGQMPLDVVHPAVYEARIRAATQLAQEHQRLVGLLASGGTFESQKDAAGRLHVVKT